MSSRPLRALAAGVVVALVGAGGAAAASAPTASTGPVTAIGPTTATVSGSVNPNGAATTWYVEYGTTTSYGSKTSATSAGSGTSSVSVSPMLTGLTAGTSYHYRVVATSTLGTGHGADGLLTTSAAPQVVTGSASSVTTASATLNGTVNPSSRATSWHFEYGTSTSYGTSTAAKDAGSGTSPVAVAAPITGLTGGRTYHFRLVATSDAGTSRGSDQTFVAAGAPSVTTKAASSVKDTSATLNAVRQRERPGDDRVLRLRHDHELRLQDGCEEHRLGRQLDERRDRRDRAHARQWSTTFAPSPRTPRERTSAAT